MSSSAATMVPDATIGALIFPKDPMPTFEEAMAGHVEELTIAVSKTTLVTPAVIVYDPEPSDETIIPQAPSTPGALSANDLPTSPVEEQPDDHSVVQPGLLVSEIAPELEGELVKDQTVPVSHGGYAQVYKGIWKRPGKPDEEVAIKSLICTHMKDSATEEERQQRCDIRLKRETTVWKQTNHRHIHPFYGYKSAPEQCLVSPWCPHQSFRKYLAANTGLTILEKLRLLKQAAEGLHYLHALDPPIAHGDIKTDNVLINRETEAALVDFGLSRVLSGLNIRSGFTTTGIGQGTNGYVAPEILNGARPSLAADVYAFSSLILAVLSGQRPFHKIKAPAIALMTVVSGQIPAPTDHPDFPEEDSLWPFMRLCWQLEPGERPDIATVVEKLHEEIDLRAPVNVE